MRATAILALCLALFAGAASANHVCNSGWKINYDVTPNGLSYGVKTADTMYSRIIKAAVESEGCKYVKTVQLWNGCYDSVVAVGSKQLVGDYGFGSEVLALCPGFKQPRTYAMLVMATATRTGSFKLTFVEMDPYSA